MEHEVIDKLVQEILNLDQILFNKEFNGDMPSTEQISEWYRKTGAEHALIACECYNAAWNISEMLEGMDTVKIKELSENVGIMGLASHAVAKQYKSIWKEFNNEYSYQIGHA